MYINYLFCLNESSINRSRRVRSSFNDYKTIKSQYLNSSETRVKMRAEVKNENISIKLPSLGTYRKPIHTNESQPLKLNPISDKTHSVYNLASHYKHQRSQKGSKVLIEHNSTTDQELQVDL